MKVELNSKEIEMLDSALKVWEKQPQSDAFGHSLMSVMLSGISRKDGDEKDDAKYESKTKEIMEKGEIESKLRERQVLLLRAKLSQAAAVQSEHEIPA